MKPLLSPHTSRQIDGIVAKKPHGILLSGMPGSGKGTAARHISAQLLAIPIEKLDFYPHLSVIAPSGTSISIDQIRQLHQFLSLRTPGEQVIRRVVIIEDAHTMTTEAQNALLKSLEEPPADTAIILTAPATKQLKDTIYSRVQQVTVLPVSAEQASAHFGDTFSEEHLKKAHLMSNGHAGLLYALLTNAEHPLANEVARAKRMLSASIYDRLIQVDELSKQKEQLPLFLQACKLICNAALKQAAAKGAAQTKRWHRALTAVHEAEATLPANPNTKLLLTNLFLHV